MSEIQKTNLDVTNDLIAKFEKFVKKADKFNSRARNRRFCTFHSTSNSKNPDNVRHTIGVYDSVKKKYEITELNHYGSSISISRMFSMVEKAVNESRN